MSRSRRLLAAFGCAVVGSGGIGLLGLLSFPIPDSCPSLCLSLPHWLVYWCNCG